MNDFKPYTIFRWDLSAPELLPQLQQNIYISCWWKQIPLGHVWQLASAETERNILIDINEAIAPALNYYLQPEEQTNEKNIRTWLKDFDYAAIHQYLVQALNNNVDSAAALNVSVVICTRNRAMALENCLHQLLQCTGNYDIIVVDNDPSNDATKKICSDFPEVKYVAEPRMGLDIARNSGAMYATGDIIAYTDDDVTVPPNWVQNISTAFTDPLTMAITGLVLPLELNSHAQYIFERDWSFNKGYLPVIFDHGYFIQNIKWGVPAWEIGAGANMAFRREAFQLAGFFDERLDAGAAGCSGDSEMWFRILAEGWNCQYLPQLYVFHQHRSNDEALKNQLYNYMRGHVAALLVQNEKYPGTGNLRRIWKGLPLYYSKKIARQLLIPGEGKDAFLSQQIKGCIAGWKYYRANRQQQPQAKNESVHQNDCTRDNESNELVSVIIPCFNHAKYLPEAIESVLQQTYCHKEIIVVDDGSAEDIYSICNKYDLVKYIRVERVGLAAARNIGIQFSTGGYLVFLDADDFLYAEALEINRYFFDLYKDVCMVSGAHQRVDEKAEPLVSPAPKTTAGENYIALLQGNYIAMEGAVMYRRKLFFNFKFDTRFKACEDYQLNLNIARHYPVFGHDKIIAAYRIHHQNMSANKKKMVQYALMTLQEQKGKLKNEQEKAAWENGIKNWKNFYK